MRDWSGTPEQVHAQYMAAKSRADAETRFSSLHYSNKNGRATLVARYGRSGAAGGAPPTKDGDHTGVIEELYGVDIIRDIRRHPEFASGGTYALTGTEIANVWDAVERRAPQTSEWSAAQKKLYGMGIRGDDSYFETGFILRRTIWGARSTQVRASFTQLNGVVAGITLSAKMKKLVAALPVGEWLKKSPSCEYTGRGQWRVSLEYHWAKKWSVVYGGTLDFAEDEEEE
jgi:hypothetical protein